VAASGKALRRWSWPADPWSRRHRERRRSLDVSVADRGPDLWAAAGIAVAGSAASRAGRFR